MNTSRVLFKKKWLVYASTVVLAPLWCAIGGFSVAGASSGNNHFLMGVAWLGLIIISAWLLLEFFSLMVVIQEEGVSFLTLKGRGFLLWEEIIALQVIPPILILQSPNRRVRILLTFYNQPSKVIEHIQSKTISTD